MKKIKTVVFSLILSAILFPAAACAAGSKDKTENNKSMTAPEIKGGSDSIVNQAGTPVILEMNGTEVRATLNNTLTAKEFIKLLPYSVTVSRAADDLCGSVHEDLPSDEAEGRNSWKIGEIGWFGGWFTILVDNEEKFSSMPGVMIIGKIDDEYLETVQAFSGQVDITVRNVEPKELREPDNSMKLIVGDTTLTATLVDNSTTEALKEMLSDGPVTIDMRDYGSMEKVGPFPQSLPRNDEQITTEAGDLILYQGNSFVIYYAPNSWNFTRIGKINNITGEELKKILGNGNVSVTLSLD
jgi:hypothetical protein